MKLRALVAFSGLLLAASVPVQAQQPEYVWHPSLGLRWDDPAVLPVGGTEIRSLIAFGGKLFAGNGYWMDSSANDPALPGAQVLRLDAPGGEWKADLELKERNLTGLRTYMAIASLAQVRFTTDTAGKPLPAPAEFLLAGVWKRGTGLDLFSRPASSSTWTKTEMPGEESAPRGSQLRAFAMHRDASTGIDTVFGGGTKSIFTGTYDKNHAKIVWKPQPEWRADNSGDPEGPRGRVASFAECGGRFYAGAFDTILERTDGTQPAWKAVFTLQIHSPSDRVTGLRGLTCIHNAAGQPALLAGVEDNPTSVVRVDLQQKDSAGLYRGAQELDASAFLSRTLGVRATYGIVAYNDMLAYPGATKACTQYMMGVEANTPQAPDAFRGHLAQAYFLLRDCSGAYTLHKVADDQLTPKPQIESLRTVVASPFAADPPGTLYAGGFDCNRVPSHNTAWLYRGTPKR